MSSQVVAARAVAPALHAEDHRAVVERGLAVAVVDALERGQQRGELLGVVAAHDVEPAHVVAVLERVVRLVDALARPALAARRARQREGDDAREVPLERELDEPDHLVVDGGELIAVVLVFAVAGGAAGSRAGHGCRRASSCRARRAPRRWPSRPRASRRPGRRACARARSPCRARAWRRRCPASRKSIRLFLRCERGAEAGCCRCPAGSSPWSRSGSRAASACRRPARRLAPARSRCRTASRRAARLRYEM